MPPTLDLPAHLAKWAGEGYDLRCGGWKRWAGPGATAARNLVLGPPARAYARRPGDVGFFEHLQPILGLVLGFGSFDVFSQSSRPRVRRQSTAGNGTAARADAGTDCLIGHGFLRLLLLSLGQLVEDDLVHVLSQPLFSSGGGLFDTTLSLGGTARGSQWPVFSVVRELGDGAFLGLPPGPGPPQCSADRATRAAQLVRSASSDPQALVRAEWVLAGCFRDVSLASLLRAGAALAPFWEALGAMQEQVADLRLQEPGPEAAGGLVTKHIGLQECVASVGNGVNAHPIDRGSRCCRSLPGCEGMAGTDLEGEVIEVRAVEGETEVERDASCCAMCLQNLRCGFWTRASAREDRRCWLKKNFERQVPNSARRGHMREAFVVRSMSYAQTLFCLVSRLGESAVGPLVMWDWFLGRGGSARMLAAGGQAVGATIVSFEISASSIAVTRPDFEAFGDVQVVKPRDAPDLRLSHGQETAGSARVLLMQGSPLSTARQKGRGSVLKAMCGEGGLAPRLLQIDSDYSITREWPEFERHCLQRGRLRYVAIFNVNLPGHNAWIAKRLVQRFRFRVMARGGVLVQPDIGWPYRAFLLLRRPAWEVRRGAIGRR